MSNNSITHCKKKTVKVSNLLVTSVVRNIANLISWSAGCQNYFIPNEVGPTNHYLRGGGIVFILDYTVKIVEWPLTQWWGLCAQLLVILIILFLECSNLT